MDDGLDLELEVADRNDIPFYSITMEYIVDGYFEKAFEFLPEGKGQLLLYRGWMLKETEYEHLFYELEMRGYYLVTNPYQYAQAHYLPNYYPLVKEFCAPTVWMWGTDLEDAWKISKELGEPPYLLKDHVKSAKEDWQNSCFIPRDVDRESFNQICENFIDYQGERFERGLVFRKVLPLKPLGYRYMDQPLFEEYRLFFWDKKLITAEAYYEIASKESDFSEFNFLGDLIESPFFTADIARLTNDEWRIVELGDGGVSTLPPLLDPIRLYRIIFEI